MLFYRPLYLLWFATMCAVSPFVGKVRRGLRGRRGLLSRVKAATQGWSGQPYWFHFASSGEFEQTIPILDALRAREPNCRIFLTYFSPTGRRAVDLEVGRRGKSGLRVPWDAADFSPLDFPSSVRGFLKVLQPRALVVLNREFWPELFQGCYQRNIPIFVFAAFFSKQARRWARFYKPWLMKVTFLGTTDLSTADFLRQDFDSGRVEPLGDPRIERVLERRRLKPTVALPVESDSRVFVAASLWPEDFEAMKPTLEFLLELPDWTIYLVPHEPEERFLRVLEKWLTQVGAPHTRWSRKSEPLARVVLIDSVGWLAELYRHATVAFVGGGFRSRVHNVLEPAAYGIPVLTGPFIQNSHEAVEMSRCAGGLFAANDGQALLDFMSGLVQDSFFRIEQGQLALEYVEQGNGAGVRYSNCLADALTPHSTKD